MKRSASADFSLLKLSHHDWRRQAPWFDGISSSRNGRIVQPSSKKSADDSNMEFNFFMSTYGPNHLLFIVEYIREK